MAIIISGLAIGNTITALEAGADQIDGTLRGLGAGAGNAPTEVLVAVLNKMGIDTGINLSILMDSCRRNDCSTYVGTDCH